MQKINLSAVNKRTAGYVLIGAAALFLLSNQDFRMLVHNLFEIRAAKHEDIRLDAQYEELRREKERLLKNDDYIERIARRELTMIRPGEIEYRFDPPVKKAEKK